MSKVNHIRKGATVFIFKMYLLILFPTMLVKYILIDFGGRDKKAGLT